MYRRSGPRLTAVRTMVVRHPQIGCRPYYLLAAVVEVGFRQAGRGKISVINPILTLRRSLNEAGEEVDLRTKGRHDPCVGIRAVPVVEAMTACVLADAFLRHRAQTGGGAFAPGRRERD